MKQHEVKPAMYLRLSDEDKRSANRKGGVSRSIETQREICTKYALRQGWPVPREFVDDGKTGTNFDREDYQQMRMAIEKGEINCVIAKDLSRFGRALKEMLIELDDFLLDYSVRLIFIEDGIDVTNPDDYPDEAELKMAVNAMHPRKCSRGIRGAWVNGVENGKAMFGRPPHGYVRGAENKHRYEIDPEAAAIVQRIFDEYDRGATLRSIAEGLNADGVDSPDTYRRRKLDEPQKKVVYWSEGTIRSIIENEAYIGTLIQGKRRKKSYRSTERVQIPKDQWYRAENAHAPIIDPEQWHRVNDRRNSTKRHKKTAKAPHSRKTKEGHVGIFSGLLRCGDCGAALAYTTAGNAPIYRCSDYNNKGKTACSPHHISEAALVEIVKAEVAHYASLANENRPALVERVLQQVTDEHDQSSNALKVRAQELERGIKKNQTASRALFEEKLAGNIPDNVFQSMMQDYSRDLEGLQNALGEVEAARGRCRRLTEDVERWTALIEKYLSLDDFNRIAATELIESIIVHEPIKNKGERIIKLDIQYRFVGNLAPKNNDSIA